MPLNHETALDNLARIVQVIQHDPQMLVWFRALARESTVARRNEIYLMVKQLNNTGEDPELAASFQLLADDKVFAAASAVLKEHC